MADYTQWWTFVVWSAEDRARSEFTVDWPNWLPAIDWRVEFHLDSYAVVFRVYHNRIIAEEVEKYVADHPAVGAYTMTYGSDG